MFNPKTFEYKKNLLFILIFFTSIVLTHLFLPENTSTFIFVFLVLNISFIVNFITKIVYEDFLFFFFSTASSILISAFYHSLFLLFVTLLPLTFALILQRLFLTFKDFTSDMTHYKLSNTGQSLFIHLSFWDFLFFYKFENIHKLKILKNMDIQTQINFYYFLEDLFLDKPFVGYNVKDTIFNNYFSFLVNHYGYQSSYFLKIYERFDISFLDYYMSYIQNNWKPENIQNMDLYNIVKHDNFNGLHLKSILEKDDYLLNQKIRNVINNYKPNFNPIVEEHLFKTELNTF